MKVASVPLDYRPLSFGTFSLICCILMILQVQCTACSNVSDQYENMMDLTVEIHGDAVSLEECLDQFTAKEWLQGDNLYKCDRYCIPPESLMLIARSVNGMFFSNFCISFPDVMTM